MGDEEVWYATIVGVIVLSGLSIFCILYLAKKRRTKTNDAWKQAATELGLDFTPVTRMFGKYRMSGVIGKQLSCSVWAYAGPNNQGSYTTYMNYDVWLSCLLRRYRKERGYCEAPRAILPSSVDATRV